MQPVTVMTAGQAATSLSNHVGERVRIDGAVFQNERSGGWIADSAPFVGKDDDAHIGIIPRLPSSVAAVPFTGQLQNVDISKADDNFVPLLVGGPGASHPESSQDFKGWLPMTSATGIVDVVNGVAALKDPTLSYDYMG